MTTSGMTSRRYFPGKKFWGCGRHMRGVRYFAEDYTTARAQNAFCSSGDKDGGAQKATKEWPYALQRLTLRPILPYQLAVGACAASDITLRMLRTRSTARWKKMTAPRRRFLEWCIVPNGGPETRRDAVPENVRRPLPSPGAVLRVCSARAAACLPGRSSSPSSSWAHIMRWQQRASAHRQAGRLRGPPPATIPASHDATSATDGRRRRRAEPPATKARRSR